MAATVHGWRVFNVKRCNSHEGEVIIAGLYGKHVHSRHMGRARCRSGGRATYAMWITEEAEKNRKLKKEEVEPHDLDDCPHFDCTCGYYFYRLYDLAVGDNGSMTSQVLAHVTCIGETVLHTEGGRTSRYQVDYILPPKPDSDLLLVQLPDDVPKKDDTEPDLWHLQMFGPMTTVKMGPAVEGIAQGLGVPILERDDLSGCQDCLLANAWRSQAEIDEFNREVHF